MPRSEIFIDIPTNVKKGVVFNTKLFVQDLKEGFLYVKRDKVLSNILPIVAGVNFFFVPFFILLPKLVTEHLTAGSIVYGYIESACNIKLALVAGIDYLLGDRSLDPSTLTASNT